MVGAPPRVPMVGVPATPGGRWVRGGWRVIAVSLLKMYVRMTWACEILVGVDWCRCS